jgi:hypothetical protein
VGPGKVVADSKLACKKYDCVQPKKVVELEMDKRVVILILVHKREISQNEILSLRQCISVLGGYEIRLICPAGLDVSAYRRACESLRFDFINPYWQSSWQNFNRLKISPVLYHKYREYQFILFYELDAFVFRDELLQWCDAGYDYIGAPWFENFVKCTEDSPFIGVGNGGFSLRRTSAALRVLHSFSYIWKPQELLCSSSLVPRELSFMAPTIAEEQWTIKKMRRLLRNLTIANNTFYAFNDCSENEDNFWGLFVKRNFSWFKVAPFEEAKKFSIELNARLLFRLNGNKLPFGCHAWLKYDPDFWIPHIQAHCVATRM